MSMAITGRGTNPYIIDTSWSWSFASQEQAMDPEAESR